MSRSPSHSAVGPWAKQKLDALERYLDAYHMVMKNQKFTLIYIDAFAGSGRSMIRQSAPKETELAEGLFPEMEPEQDEFIAGSPLRALKSGRGFDEYHFFDLSRQRADELARLEDEFPDKKIHVINEDGNLGVQKLVQSLDGKYARGVAFLDPFGPHLHWTTVEALAGSKKFDVILNFPLGMAINRLITRNTEIPQNWEELLDKCFGTHDWYGRAYRVQKDLLGDETSKKRADTASRLLDLYHQRLKNTFGHSAPPRLVRNSKGSPLYHLLWASWHKRGEAIADHIMHMGEKI